MYHSAFVELGLSEEQFWDLDWFEFDRMEQHLRFTLARQWEPIRELQTMLYNMFADTPTMPQELLPLLTDHYVVKRQPKNDQAANKAVWDRLVAAKDSPAEPKNDH